MRIKDLSEGVVDSFKAGYRAPIIGKGALGGSSASGSISSTAKKKTTGSAFDLLSKQEAIQILDTVINGAKLDDNQVAKLQQIRNRL